MRILLVTDHYPPFIGGAHRQAHLLAAGMVDRGHEVDVVTPWHGSLPTFEHSANLSVYRVRQLRTAVPALIRDPEQRHQPPFPDPVTMVSLRRLIDRIKPELIHAYGWMAFSVATALGRKRIPMLISARDYGYFCATRTLLRKNAPCSGPAPIKCTGCAADYYGPPKGLAATAGVYIFRPALARKMTGLHSVSTFVHEVTTRYLFGPTGRSRGTGRGDHPELPGHRPDREDDHRRRRGGGLPRATAGGAVHPLRRRVPQGEGAGNAVRRLPAPSRAASPGADGDLRARLADRVPARGRRPHRRPAPRR